MAEGSDPLTSPWAMIAAIEPGFRMIDGSLVKELYILAGMPAEAAVIEPGFRLIDTTLLVQLALTINNGILAQDFINQMPGKRLIDGTPWKQLAFDTLDVAPPENVTAPYVSGPAAVGGVLSCTVGEWTGEPTAYHFQWQSGGTPVGTDSNSYMLKSADVGQDVGCVVTAINYAGSGQAPLSNTITIPAP